MKTEVKARKTKHGVAELRVIGRRAYVVRADEVLLATKGRWELSEFLNWRNEGWVSLKLFDTHSQARRRVYQLGYGLKDQRMAVNAHLYVLQKRYPEIEGWILETMRELHVSGVLSKNLARKKAAQ